LIDVWFSDNWEGEITSEGDEFEKVEAPKKSSTHVIKV